MSLEVASFHDIQDSEGKWFLGKVVEKENPSLGDVKIHYVGFPSKFDEVISCLDKTRRIAAAGSKIPDCRLTTFNVGDSVDTFVKVLNRWETLKVCEKSACGKKLRVGFRCCQWLNANSEEVLIAKTRTSKPSDNVSPFPNGIANALFIAKKYLQDSSAGSKHIAAMMYEELARYKLLPETLCYSLFNLYEKGELHPIRIMPESIRFINAKAAFILAAIDIEDEENVVNHCIDVEHYDHLSDEGFVDDSVTGVNRLLRYMVKFRIALMDIWATLPQTTQFKLELADYLEVCALKNTNSTIRRRLLFAEAALIIEDVKISHFSRLLQDTCNFRLARHYINGLGIDITDPEHQDAADIQAGEYLKLSKSNEYVAGILGILLSTGRTAIIASTESGTSCEFILDNLFDVSIAAGGHAASFWKAKLLFDGWGQQTKGSNRIESLQEAQRLFSQCHDFNFMPMKAKESSDRIRELLEISGTNQYISKPSYLLALYLFRKILQLQVNEKFTEALLKCIKKFIKEEKLPGPTADIDKSTAEWITDISQLVFTSTSSNTSDSDCSIIENKAKELPTEMQNNMTSHRLYQRFITCCTVNSTEENSKSWTKELTLRLLKDKIFVLVRNVKHIFETYDGKLLPTTEARKRIIGSTIIFPEINELWTNTAVRIADMIYDNISPCNRHLVEQYGFADNVMETLASSKSVQSAVQAYTGVKNVTVTTTKLSTLLSPISTLTGHSSQTSPVSFLYCVVQIVKQARELAYISREAEPDIINKHSRSAEALLTFSHKEVLTLQQAMQQLDTLSRDLVRGGGLNGYPTRIGYHTIINAKSIRDYLLANSSNSQKFLESRVLYLQRPENSKINNGWRGGLDKSLLAIFEEFRSMVTSKMENMTTSSLLTGSYTPVLNLPAVTYADPWSSITLVSIDETFQHLISDEIINALPAGMFATKADAIQQILYDRVKEKFRSLNVDFPNLIGYPDQSARIQLIKKMLYLLLNYPDMDWENEVKIELLGLHLTFGLRERCPDGISQFCDEFIEKMGIQANDFLLGEMPPEATRMIFSVVSMINQLKQHFISQHVSCLERHFEGRTIGTITLKYMLLLPLSLKGDFGQIKYPRYATEGHANPTQMQSEEVCLRYLDGGFLQYDYGEEMVVEGMSIYRLATVFRQAIAKKDGDYKRPMAEKFNDNCRNRSLFCYLINEEIVEEFVAQDVLTSSFYNKSKSHGYSCENIFFKAIVAEEGDPVELLRPVIARVMKDSLIIRILEVAQYVTVNPEFWSHVTSDWTISEYI